MKFLYQITAASRTPDYGATTPQIPFLSVLCLQLNLLNPPREQNSWVRHWSCMNGIRELSNAQGSSVFREKQLTQNPVLQPKLFRGAINFTENN